MALQFAPFSSRVSTSFWSSLARKKVDQLQLSDDAVPVRARYSVGRRVFDRKSGEYVALPVGLHLDADSLDGTVVEGLQSGISSSQDVHIPLSGHLKNFNTVEEYKNADKSSMLDSLGEELLTVMKDDPNPLQKLNTFIILSFADLKKFKFIYWFAYPALVATPGWQVSEDWKSLEDAFDNDATDSLASIIASLPASHAGFFLIHPSGRQGSVVDFEDFFRDVPLDERIVGFIDPSPHRTTPGWPLRNLLTFLSIRYKVDRIKVLCWKGDAASSVIVGLKNTRAEEMGSKTALPINLRDDDNTKPSVVGWERNSAGKLGPKLADLGPLMDPKRLADQAVDLNLKLMRWRILPEINLEKIQSTRCLLLGAGTLGCYVARTLLGWGVRTITFVDSSTVSFSNPVRQPLFEYQDSLNGGKGKAQCAAESLQRIYPGVESKGFQFNIPMPGHPIPEASIQKTRDDIKQLEDLIADHDVIYLLMDSRESRWLPTVIGAAKGKLVMNTALGFDTFLAMRHGANPSQQLQRKDSTRLGCYFCNDIVAPTDSLTDRTLDQMCTVTRPGIAAIASAMTVELMVSVLQHPDGILAGAYSNQIPEQSILGHLPHQLRGSLFQFNTLLIHGPAYDKCTACSAIVIQEYENRGFEMVQKACNDETYLRSLTGLDKLYDATDDIEVDWSEGEEDIQDEEGELL